MIIINTLLSFVIILLTTTDSFADIYDNKSVIILRNTNDANSFFGYSVFLQKGNPARVVIGAPKHGSNSVGSVFVCSAQSNADNIDGCKSYSFERNIPGNPEIFHNNLFGASIDGGTNQNDIIMIGAPKYTLNVPASQSYFTNGAAFRLSDLEKQVIQKLPKVYEPNIDPNPNRPEYQYGYAQCGFSLSYINASDFLFGLPGYGHWKGQAFHTFETDFDDFVPEARRFSRKHRREVRTQYEKIIKTNFEKQDAAGLAGYAVTSGNFFGHLSFVIGMPNANDMLGSVKLYNGIKQELVVKSTEPQIGEHFGSVLCAADVNGDGYDDLLIGAPNYASDQNTFDNGMVYVYLSDTKDNLIMHQTLKGKIACRFGTSITNLGKISLDKHDAVAIGSPYENGVGAVHVYVWSNGELVLDSKIKMMHGFRAFGYSLSRAVDIDANKISDFAVGDYRSNAVAILKAKSVFFYDIKTFYPTIYAHEDAKPFEISVCLSVEGINMVVQTEVILELDSRLKQNINRKYNVDVAKNRCIKLKLDFNVNAPRLDPLNLLVKLQEQNCDNCPIPSPTYPKIFNMKIPFNYNCKEEICRPEIMITPSMNINSFIVGGETHVSLRVRIKNVGDPAFVCSTEVITEPSIDVIPSSNTCKEMPCQTKHIINDIEMDFQLRLSNLENVEKYSQFAKIMKIAVNVSCVNISSTAISNLQINYKHSLDIQGSDIGKQYDSVNKSTYNVQGELVYFLKNNGPSPLQEETFTIRIPRSLQDIPLIYIFMPDVNGYELDSDERFDNPLEESDPVGDTSDGEVTPAGAGLSGKDYFSDTISCDDSQVQCMTITGRIRLMTKYETRKITIPVQANIPEILKHYRSTFTISSILITSENSESHIAKLGIVDVQTIIDGVSVWIIVGSIIGGLIVLAVIIFVLKKLNFFSRPKREKLLEEKELDGMELNTATAEAVDESGNLENPTDIQPKVENEKDSKIEG